MTDCCGEPMGVSTADYDSFTGARNLHKGKPWCAVCGRVGAPPRDVLPDTLRDRSTLDAWLKVTGWGGGDASADPDETDEQYQARVMAQLKAISLRDPWSGQPISKTWTKKP